jgi:DNA-binding response OmpR family regulator
MADPVVAHILLVEDNPDFANLVDLFLKKHHVGTFNVTWRGDGVAAIKELETNSAINIILMDYFLPGKNGLEVTRDIRAKGFTVPVVFLTVNKDFDLAVEVLKLGVEDYLVKEEISTPVLPKTILSVIERRKLKDQLTGLEISQKRLETIQEIVQQVTGELEAPIEGMRDSIDSLLTGHEADNLRAYLVIIRDNLIRIEKKMARLRQLKTDKTITYIRDIRMLDLSEENPPA